jgi:WS/DGAT/MGAT family acyltransferase
MLDGAAGADLSQILMSPSPRSEPREPLPYMPRPVPSNAELLRDSVAHNVRRSLGAMKSLFETASGTRSVTRSGDAPNETPSLDRRISAIREMLGYVLRPASETPINGALGQHRRLEWLTMPLEDVHELRGVFGCSVNDVVLATVTEAMRRYLFRRRVDQRRIDFRIAAPVSVRRKEHDRRQGNHVSTWIVPLPIHLEDASEQLREIRATTAARKASEAALAIDTLMEAAEWLPAALVSRSTRLAQGPANMIVTNVPGPQFPLYSVGARLLGMYPLVPLLPGGGLGVALFSYEGKLCWGFNADRELVPDLPMFVSDVLVAFEKLRAAAVSRYMNRRTGQDADSPEQSTKESTEQGIEESTEKPTRKPAAPRKRTARKAAPAPAGSPGVVSATRH